MSLADYKSHLDYLLNVYNLLVMDYTAKVLWTQPKFTPQQMKDVAGALPTLGQYFSQYFEAAAPTTPCKRAATYVELLGSGNFGQALANPDDHKQIIKKMPINADETYSEQLIGEMVTTSVLPVCPFVIRQYGWFCCEDNVLTVLERAKTNWVGGRSDGESSNLSLLMQTCFALIGMHAAGITYRDFNLGNVLIKDAPANSGWVLKVNGFSDGNDVTLYVPSFGKHALLSDFGQSRYPPYGIFVSDYNFVKHFSSFEAIAKNDYTRDELWGGVYAFLNFLVSAIPNDEKKGTKWFPKPVWDVFDGYFKAWHDHMYDYGTGPKRTDEEWLKREQDGIGKYGNPATLFRQLAAVIPAWSKPSFAITLGTYTLSAIPKSITPAKPTTFGAGCTKPAS